MLFQSRGRVRAALALAAWTGLSVWSSAYAAGAGSIPVETETPASAAQPMRPAALGAQMASAALSSDSLDTLYGTGAADPTNVAVSDQMLQASDTGNAVIAAGAVNSGALTLSGGAFGNFNGVGNFVFNTGNNNTLQGSINITVLTPPK